MKAKLAIVVLCAVGAPFVIARTLERTASLVVSKADVIVVATAISEPQRGDLLYAKNVFEGGHQYWDIPGPAETTNALAELARVRDALNVSSNYYAAELINREIWLHQYEWKTTFRVSQCLKGHSSTNITVIQGIPFTQDTRPDTRKGARYILFLKQRYTDAVCLDEFVAVRSDDIVAAKLEGQWREESLKEALTHSAFLQRIKELVRQQAKERIQQHDQETDQASHAIGTGSAPQNER